MFGPLAEGDATEVARGEGLALGRTLGVSDFSALGLGDELALAMSGDCDADGVDRGEELAVGLGVDAGTGADPKLNILTICCPESEIEIVDLPCVPSANT